MRSGVFYLEFNWHHIKPESMSKFVSLKIGNSIAITIRRKILVNLGVYGDPNCVPNLLKALVQILLLKSQDWGHNCDYHRG